MIVKADGYTFDENFYDRDVDVLYLHRGDPSTAVEWDETTEGIHTRWGANGELVGLTIVNARRILEEDGAIVVTLPERTLQITDLGDILAAA